jgi:hypothetical protein
MPLERGNIRSSHGVAYVNIPGDGAKASFAMKILTLSGCPQRRILLCRVNLTDKTLERGG